MIEPARITGAATEAYFGALETLPGDDVDHAGHRIGAVHGRGAILQHFDALHRDQRQGVEVDEGVGQAARREAVVGQAAAVEQHQRVLLRQATQTDAGRARGPATVAGFVGGVAGVGRDGAQQIGDGRLAGLLQLLAFDHLHRVGGFGVGALDVGAGHAHCVQRLAVVGGGFGGSEGRSSDGGRNGQGKQRAIEHEVLGGRAEATAAVAHVRQMSGQ
ncbi:hypothetical protein D3C71_1058010 [compost metagenome]